MKIPSLYNIFYNKLVHKMQTEDQLILSIKKRQYISLFSLRYYIFPIKKIASNLSFNINNIKKNFLKCFFLHDNEELLNNFLKIRVLTICAPFFQ